MLRAARALSSARRESMFEDLVRAATDLLGADVGLIGRYVERDGIPSIETLACYVEGRITPNSTYPLAGSPCETVIGQEFRFYPENLGYLFPESPAQENAVVGYAAYPLFSDDESELGIFTVMSYRPLTDSSRAESLLRIFSERAVSEIARINAEDELRLSEERYRSIFNAAVDGMALLSPDGRIIDVNAAMEELYGYDRSEMIGEKALRFARGSTRENAARFLTTVRNENYAAMVDKAYRRDGTEFYIEPRGVTVNYRGKKHILAVIRDVTERAVAEDERATLEAQLRQAQKMEAIGHLTGGVAHDFNNILTSVLGYVELAHDHVESISDAKLNRYLERAQRSGERARDLIQQMLTFTRGQQGEPRAMRVGPIIDDTVTLLESMVPATTRIRANLEPTLPLVVVDPVHIEQIIINLCLNARDAMPDGGMLEINLGTNSCRGEACSACHGEVRGEFVELAVRDSGTGMTPEVIERIFEPFFSTKETGKGSGMGLSTTHGIVHEYGGHILVDSVEGEGTSVRVLLPAAADQSATAPESTPDSPGEPVNVDVDEKLGGEVLLVDDNHEVAEFVGDLLAEWGLDVTTFDGGESALTHFLARPDAFALAILDQTMPAITGLKLSQLLLRERPELPVILYSGYTDEIDEGVTREAGIRALLRKPLDIEHLKTLVGDIVNELAH